MTQESMFGLDTTSIYVTNDILHQEQMVQEIDFTESFVVLWKQKNRKKDKIKIKNIGIFRQSIILTQLLFRDC